MEKVGAEKDKIPCVKLKNKTQERMHLRRHTKDQKVKLIAEVTEKMTPNFEQNANKILLSLKKDHMDKQETLDMRAALLGWVWVPAPRATRMKSCP